MAAGFGRKALERILAAVNANRIADEAIVERMFGGGHGSPFRIVVKSVSHRDGEMRHAPGCLRALPGTKAQAKRVSLRFRKMKLPY